MYKYLTRICPFLSAYQWLRSLLSACLYPSYKPTRCWGKAVSGVVSFQNNRPIFHVNLRALPYTAAGTVTVENDVYSLLISRRSSVMRGRLWPAVPFHLVQNHITRNLGRE